MKTSRQLLATAALASALLFPAMVNAGDATSPGIITSISSSATVSTKDMPQGSEMWGMWVSLPPGKRVEVKAELVPSSWMDFQLNLSGSSVASGAAPPGMCLLFGSGGRHDFGGQENATKTGDAFACNFGTGSPWWEENRGTELYARAQMDIGGPYAPGQTNTPDLYRGAGGRSYVEGLIAAQFGPVEAELRAAGAMTATIRQVTMPPGARIVVTDRYPVLRMVTDGEVKSGIIPAGSEASTAPGAMFKKGVFDWVGWRSSVQTVLSNETDKPVQYVEWSVMPAPGAKP